MTSLSIRRGSAWLLPKTFAAMIFGLAGLAFEAHVYRIDYHAVEIDGTNASLPFWQALALPSLPIAASLAALAVHQETVTGMTQKHNDRSRANKTDTGNGMYGIFRVIDASRFPLAVA